MLDKILFWVVLVWMVAMLVMAIIAIREVWKEDSQLPAEPDEVKPSEANAQGTTKSNDGQAS